LAAKGLLSWLYITRRVTVGRELYAAMSAQHTIALQTELHRPYAL
jgi:hypothetical protein